MVHHMLMYFCLIQYTIILDRHNNPIAHHGRPSSVFDRPPRSKPNPFLDERTQIIRIEEEGQKERCEQIVFHKETKVQDVINGLNMMKRESAIIYESKGTTVKFRFF